MAPRSGIESLPLDGTTAAVSSVDTVVMSGRLQRVLRVTRQDNGRF